MSGDSGEEARLLRIRINSLEYERADLLSAARNLTPRRRLLLMVGRLLLWALWLAGIASVLVLCIWLLLMSGVIKMGPG